MSIYGYNAGSSQTTQEEREKEREIAYMILPKIEQALCISCGFHYYTHDPIKCRKEIDSEMDDSFIIEY